MKRSHRCNGGGGAIGGGGEDGTKVVAATRTKERRCASEGRIAGICQGLGSGGGKGRGGRVGKHEHGCVPNLELATTMK